MEATPHTEPRVQKKEPTKKSLDWTPSERPNPNIMGRKEVPIMNEPGVISSYDAQSHSHKDQRRRSLRDSISLLDQLKSRYSPHFQDPRTPRTHKHQYITRYGRAVKHLDQCTQLAPTVAYHIYNEGTKKKENIESLRRGANERTWERSLANE